MAIVIEEQVEIGAESGTTLTLPSWTPAANELILVGVSQRNDVTITSVSGNGITHTQVDSVVCDQNLAQQDVWRGMSGSPTTGSITVDRASDDGAWLAMAIRISGVDTGGTNGSGAVEASASATNPPATDNDDMKVDVTTVTDSALALAFGCARLADFIVPAGETAIRLNFAAGSGGSNITASIWRDTALVSPPATVTLGADDDLSTAREWAVIAMSIKPAAAGAVIDLDAALTSSATLSANLTRLRPLSSALTGSATVAGSLGKIISLTSGLTSVATVGATMTRITALSSALTSSAIVSANMSPLRGLTAALSSTVVVGADLTIMGVATVLSFLPADNSFGANPNGNLVIVFDQTVTTQAGADNNIDIYKTAGDVLIESIDAQDAKVTGSGTATITINPAATLAQGTAHYVKIGADAISDYAGIADTTTWNFTTGSVSDTYLELSSTYPDVLSVFVDGVDAVQFSNEALFVSGSLDIKDGVAQPTATAGKSRIFVDATDGDLKILFGDGTLKTIQTD